MAAQTMTIPQFLNGGSYKVRKDSDFQIINKLITHMKKHRVAYRIVGTTIFIMLASADVAFAASTGIDIGGRRIYNKLLSVGKWAIIVKAAWETIHNTIKGDFEIAKKSFFSYAMVYLILLALPWIMDQIDTLFQEENAVYTTQ